MIRLPTRQLARWLGREEPPAAEPPPTPPPVVKPKPPPAPAKPTPSPPAKPIVVAVTMLGLDGDSLENVVALVERQCAERNMQPVCITDQHDFAPFRRRRMIVDQVVDAERRATDMPELAWGLYREAQFALLGRRWRPGLIISFGRAPEPACLAALEQRPG